jgi:hypothetical protein
MRYFTLFSKKKIGRDISKKNEKISDVTIFKNLYFLNKKNHPLAVLRKEASLTILKILKIRFLGSSIFSDPK